VTNKNYTIIIGLVVLNSLMFLYGFIMMDSARDISQAKDIADGINFPLLGPDIGGFAHIGPVWFYFLAIPALSGSLLVLSLWVGLFSSLKIILAYWLGDKLMGNKFAWLWVCALFLPGWQSIDNMVLVHTNMVITLTLAFLLLFYTCINNNNLKNFKWLLLVLSLAIHAHPSTVILGVFVLYFVIKKWKNINIKLISVGTIFFIVPFIPYIFDQMNNGFLDWTRIVTKVHVDNPYNIFQRLPNFIISLFYYGPLQIRNFIAMWSQIVGNVVFGFYLITLLFGVLGIVKFSLNNRSNFTFVIKALMVFLALCLMLLSLRSFIPFYMMLVLVPFMSFILAFGLKQFLHRLKKEYLFIMIVVFFILNLLPLIALTIQAQNKQFSLPNLSNIELPSGFSEIDLSNSLDGISVLNSKYLSPLLCNDIYVHGPFSIVLDYNSAIPVSFTCPEQNIKLSGKQSTAENHVFIMHKSFWDVTTIQPENWLYQSLGTTHKFINHSKSDHWNLAPFDAYTHPQRKGIVKGPKTIYEFNFQAHSNSAIVITNTLPFYMYMRVESVEIVDKRYTARKIMKNLGNWMYQCINCKEGIDIEWKIKVTTEEKNSIDINELIF